MEKELSLEVIRLRYENILNAVGEGILGLDQNFLHDFVNPAAARMLGYEETELIGVPSHQSWHAFKADGVPYSLKECPVCQAMIDGKMVEKYRDQFMRKDGTFFSRLRSLFHRSLKMGWCRERLSFFRIFRQGLPMRTG